MIQDFREDYEHPFFFVRFYFRRIMAVGVRMIKSRMRAGECPLISAAGGSF
jgi:hypothetical protein